MRHNLTIPILVALLLFQNQICLGKRIDDTAEDNSNVPNERHANSEDEKNIGELSADNDNDSSDKETAPRDEPRIKRNAYPEDYYVVHGGTQDSPTHENLKSGDTLSASESRASATGISVDDGWAMGYGKASVSGGNRGYVDGRRPANPGVETVEEFGIKSGKDVAIARVGGGGTSGEGASPSGVGYPVETGTYDRGYGNEGGPVRPVPGAIDVRGTYGSGYGNERAPTGTVKGSVDERGTYDSRYGNERTPTRPLPGSVDDRGTYDSGYGHERVPTRPATGSIDERGTYDTTYGNERSPTRPVPGVVNERGPYDRGYDNGRTPTRPVTGVAGNRGPYDRGYVNERGHERGPKPSTGQQGTDRRVVDDRYPAPDMTGVRLTPTMDKDGRVVYSYTTDGRPTFVTFTDKNGGRGVVNHFFEKKNLDNGLSGDRKITGTVFRSGFSMGYGGGNSGNGGAVAYGGGNSGAVAYGKGIKNTGGGYGGGIGDGPVAAYGSGAPDGGAVAFASGSGFVSGTGISLGDTYVGSRNSRKPNSGARSTGFSLRQGTVLGNGQGYSKSVIYA